MECSTGGSEPRRDRGTSPVLLDAQGRRCFGRARKRPQDDNARLTGHSSARGVKGRFYTYTRNHAFARCRNGIV